MVSVYACHFTSVHVRPNTRNNSRLMPTAKDLTRPSRYDVSIVTASADLETECRWEYAEIRGRYGAGEMTGDTRLVVKSFEPITWVGPVFSRTEQICSNTLERQTGRHSCKQQTFSSSILIQQLLSFSYDSKCSSYRVSCLRFRIRNELERKGRFRLSVNGPRILMWATLVRDACEKIFTTHMTLRFRSCFWRSRESVEIKSPYREYFSHASHTCLFLTRCDNN